MPTRQLREELQRLRDQLEQQPPLSEEQRGELETLIEDIELQLANEEALAGAGQSGSCRRLGGRGGFA